MKHTILIRVHPCVNTETNSAKVYVSNEDYDGSGKGIVVRQKHLGKFPTREEAEVATEKFCIGLRELMEAAAKKKLAEYTNAKP